MDTRYLDQLVGASKAKTDRNAHPLCVSCGYDLYGSPSKRCPECGHFTSGLESQKLTRETEDAIRETELALRAAPFGWKIGIAALAIRLATLAISPNGAVVGAVRAMSVIAGFSALSLALGTLRMSQVPEAARFQLSEKPQNGAAFLGVVVGVILMVTGILGP